MKKFIRIFSFVSLFVAAAFVLAGCFGGNELTQIERQMKASVNYTDSLDNIAEEDLSSSVLNQMDQESQKQGASLHLSAAVEVEKTVREKVQEAKEAHKALKDKQVIIHQNKADLKVKIADLKATIKALRDSGYTLTEEDKATLRSYLTDLKANVSDLRGTIGNVYHVIRNLRGQYRLANVDKVVDGFNRANAQMDIRVAASAKLLETFTNVDEFLKTKLPA
jgi:chromosome segregation ATPase